jgi:hypothetical protein
MEGSGLLPVTVVTAGQGPVLNSSILPRESSEASKGESHKMLQGCARTEPLCHEIALIYPYFHLRNVIVIMALGPSQEAIKLPTLHSPCRRLRHNHGTGMGPHMRDCARGRSQVLGPQLLRAAGHRQHDGFGDSCVCGR